MKVAVFGLGIIGSIWAQHYEADGVLAASWNRTPKPALPKGVLRCLEAAQQGELLHVVVSDPNAVLEVLTAIKPALGPGKTVVQSSTIDPESAKTFCEMVQRSGAYYVEAPFTGSKPAAEQRATVYFLGGTSLALDTVEPVLSKISKKRFRLDTPAQAAALKLSMNLQIATVTQALIEGFTFAKTAGIADDVFFDVLSHNVACSGLVALKGPKLRADDFAPQFSVKHLLKDLRLALGVAGKSGLPATALLSEQLQRAVEAGFAEDDFIALKKVL
jgi:3-hydroxyisobutyrate dehydrogenase-like beta-hydroxyacid dehydrogenase